MPNLSDGAYFGRVIWSSLILTALISVPVAVVAGLLGIVPGLLAIGVAIPLSGHLARLESLGDETGARIGGEGSRLCHAGWVSALAALFGIFVLHLVPAPLREVPFLPLLI